MTRSSMGAPVLAITGAPPRALLGTKFTQGVDTISLYEDVTSGVYLLPQTADLILAWA
jgi:thiamine pyrophosphate-dependent acetolactate synthase large subunit-like protein